MTEQKVWRVVILAQQTSYYLDAVDVAETPQYLRVDLVEGGSVFVPHRLIFKIMITKEGD